VCYSENMGRGQSTHFSTSLLAQTDTAETAIEIKAIPELDEDEVSACLGLTLKNGSMSKHLELLYGLSHKPDRSRGTRWVLKHHRVLIVRRRGQIRAWAMVLAGNTCHSHPSQFPTVEMFVAPRWRRRGLGSLLVSEVLARWPRAEFCPWNQSSWNFFRAQPHELGYSFSGSCWVKKQEAKNKTA